MQNIVDICVTQAGQLGHEQEPELFLHPAPIKPFSPKSSIREQILMNSTLCPNVQPFADPIMDEILSTMSDVIRRKMSAVGWIRKVMAVLAILISIAKLWTKISVLLDEISKWFDEAKTAGEMIMRNECYNFNCVNQKEIKGYLVRLYDIVDRERNQVAKLQAKLSQSSIPPSKLLRRIDALLENMDDFCLNLSIAQDDELQKLAAQAQSTLNAML